ncbi:MAG: DnaB-like helicase C-terminal domain-containing protein, partial [Bacilli bacterium]
MVDIVREKYFLRAIIRACSQTIYDAQHNHGSIDMFIEGVEEKILGISQDRVGDSIKKADEQVNLAVQQIQRLITSKGELVGVPTGFKDLDTMMRGLHANEMIVIAGRPGTGKTSIALNIAESAIFGKNRVPVFVLYLEMLSEQLYMSMIE